jgi:hypothetical protein
MLWGVVAFIIAVVLMAAIIAALARSMSTHRRDIKIVDMRNRGLGAKDIAAELDTTEDDIRAALKRLTIGFGDAGI